MRIAYRDWLLGIGYLAAYVALDAFSFVQPLLKLGITPWNPDAGLTLAFLLLRGWRQVFLPIGYVWGWSDIIARATAWAGLQMHCTFRPK